MTRAHGESETEPVEWVQVLRIENLPGHPNPMRELLG